MKLSIVRRLIAGILAGLIVFAPARAQQAYVVTTCGTVPTTLFGQIGAAQYLTINKSGQLCVSGAGGSGGAVTVADGADTALGTTTDAAWTSGSGTLIAIAKKIANGSNSSITSWGGGTLGAMANYGTSPGAVLVPGVNAFITNTPTVTANAGTNLNTSALALESGGNLATISGAIVSQGTALGSIKNLMAAGSVTTSAPSYTTGQISPLSLDTSGNVRVTGGVAQGSTTSGQTGSLVLGAATTAAPAYTTGQSSPLSVDLNGGLRVSPIPAGITQITASATGTTAATTATLAGVSNKTTYICGFMIGADATAFALGTATVTGTITGTLSFRQSVGALATATAQLTQTFNPCVPASATNTGIAVVSIAAGSGGNTTVSAWGFQL